MVSGLIYAKSADIELARIDDEFYINKRSVNEKPQVLSSIRFIQTGVRETGGIMKAFRSHPISDESFFISKEISSYEIKALRAGCALQRED